MKTWFEIATLGGLACLVTMSAAGCTNNDAGASTVNFTVELNHLSSETPTVFTNSIDVHLRTLGRADAPVLHRRQACRALALRAASDRRAMAALVDALADPTIGFWAADELAAQEGAETRRAVRKFVAEQDEQDGANRLAPLDQSPARWLVEIAASDQPSLDLLLRGMADPRPAVQFHAINVASYVATEEVSNRSAIENRLWMIIRGEGEAEERLSAAAALIEFARADDTVRQALVEIMNNSLLMPRPRTRALLLLEQTGGLTVEDMLKLIDEPDPVMQLFAVRMLGTLSSDPEHLPRLLAVAESALAFLDDELLAATTSAIEKIVKTIQNERLREMWHQRIEQAQHNERMRQNDLEIRRSEIEHLANMRHMRVEQERRQWESQRASSNARLIGGGYYGESALRSDAEYYQSQAAASSAMAGWHTKRGDSESARWASNAAERESKWATWANNAADRWRDQ